MEQLLLRIYFLIQKLVFQPIDQAAFDKLMSQGNVLEKDGWGTKVIETEEQNIVKIFRLKRAYSSALLFPYACRFRRNAKRLKKKGIETVEVKKIVYCMAEQRHLLTYKKISGFPVKALIENNNSNTELIKQLIKFIVSLHKKGIYFRSLHFGNVIVTTEGEMALIDIADLKIYPWSLSVNQRRRNWRHLLKYSFEKNVISQFGSEYFFDIYAELSNFSKDQTFRLKKALID